MSMYFYDETDDWPEYKIVRENIQQMETAHTEIRKTLHEIEPILRSDPDNKALKTKIDGLKKELKEIEKKLDESSSLYR